MVWTDEKTEQLKVLWNDGDSASKIGKTLGVSRNSIIGKADRLGLAERRRAEAKPKPPRKPRRMYQAGPRMLGRPPKYVEPPQPVPETAVTFFELERHHCRFPIGDPQIPAFRFCGGQKSTGESYCAWHCRIAYTTPREISDDVCFRRHVHGLGQVAKGHYHSYSTLKSA